MERQLRFALGVKCPELISSRSTRELMLHRQVKMFASVAASSMPTVHQFFVLYKVSSRAKWSSLKSILMKSRFSSTKVKIRDCDPSLNSTEYSRAARKPDLEANGHERETPP